MHEKVVYLSKEGTERFNRFCKDTAQELWDGEDIEDVYTRARARFPGSSQEYVTSLIGKTPEAQFRFVRTWLVENIETELRESNIPAADAFTYYTHRRSRRHEQRLLEKDSPPE